MIIVIPDRNIRKADFSGAFDPESQRFAKIHGQNFINSFDASCRPSIRFLATLNLMIIPQRDRDRRVVFAAFCHGTKKTTQFGLNMQNAQQFCNELSMFAHDEVIIILYACLTALDLAPELKRIMMKKNRYFRIYAHSTAGHTTMNPHVHLFSRDYSGYIIAPQQRQLWRKWKEALHTDFRFEFPFLRRDEILTRIG